MKRVMRGRGSRSEELRSLVRASTEGRAWKGEDMS